jgi:hypothetical protein
MTEHPELYCSYITKGSYFYYMLNCGPDYNRWVEIALTYIPQKILWKYRCKLAFFGSGAMDACRISPQLRQKREIILLSERIFPKKGADEGVQKTRYFIFVVLHEVAHAIKNHRTNNLTKDESFIQEKEADELAIAWFNGHVAERNNPYLKTLNFNEINRTKAYYQKLREKVYEQG